MFALNQEKAPSRNKALGYAILQAFLITTVLLVIMYFKWTLVGVFTIPSYQGYFWEQVVYWIRETISFQYLFIIPVSIYYLWKIKREITNPAQLKAVQLSLAIWGGFWVYNIAALVVASFTVYYPENELVVEAFKHMMLMGESSRFFMFHTSLIMVMYLIGFSRNLNKTNLREADDATARLADGTVEGEEFSDEVSQTKSIMR